VSPPADDRTELEPPHERDVPAVRGPRLAPEPRPPLTLALAPPVASQGAELVGAKALRLGQLLLAGLPVPLGFVITTAASRLFFAAIEDELGRRLRGLGSGELAKIREAAREARALIDRTPLPAVVAEAVRSRYAELGLGAVAVRSSAPHEDGAARSLAGLFDSFLDVQGEEDLLARVRACFASCFSERAIDAALRRGGAGLAGPAMAVLVQRMVPARHAGILFTRDPGGREDRMLLELVRGSGEKVAQGEVTPARFALERAGGGARHEAGDAPADLDARAFAALARLGLAAEELFAGPQDIEWAEAEGQVWLLQSRPITGRLAGAAGGPPAAGARERWTPANSQEALDDPVTPLTFSFLRPAIERGRRAVFDLLEVEDPPGEYMRLIEGRIYFNAEYFKTFLARVPGIPTEIFDQLIFGEGVGPEATIRFPTPPLTVRTAKILAFIARRWLAAKRRMDRFIASFDAKMRALGEVDLLRLADAALLAHLERVSAELEAAFNLHVLGTAMAGAHHLLLAKFLKSEGLGELATADELVGAAQGMETARGAAAIFDLAERAAARPEVRRRILEGLPVLPETPGGADFLAALERFLADYGHRAEKEAELAAPRWREDPSFVFGLVRRFLEDRGALRSPAEVEAALRARKRAVLERLEREVGERRGRAGAAWRKAVLRQLVRWAERYAPYRENLRFHALRAHERVRQIFLEVGRRLASRGVLARAEDVFFLEAEEARRSLEAPGPGGGGLAARAAERRAAYEGYLAQGAPRSSGAAPHAEKDGRRFLEGVPVSGGVVAGRIRKVETLEQALSIRPDEILLARVASPAWTPVFFLAKGVVLDIGGMLSHCAVVAREYGIPCVVGVKAATALLADGDEVTLDANVGRVYLP
jgi:pyruvate,water dikinase